MHTVFEPARTSGAAASDSVLVLASYVRYPYNYVRSGSPFPAHPTHTARPSTHTRTPHMVWLLTPANVNPNVAGATHQRVPQLALHALVRICSLADAGHAQKRTSSLLGYLGDRVRDEEGKGGATSARADHCHMLQTPAR